MIQEDIRPQFAFARKKAFRALDLVQGWLIGGVIGMGLIAASGLQVTFLHAMHGL